MKILWFIHRPERDIEDFERWYQDEHVPIGMRQEFLQRFRLSRSFYPQPRFVVEEMGSEEPRAYRFSEGYWPTIEDVRACYRSPGGRAALSNGLLNLGPLVPSSPRPVLLLDEEVLPVHRELDFDFRTGRYRAPQACKLFGIFRFGDSVGRWNETFRDHASAAAGHPDLRGLALGHAIPEVIKLGRYAQLPPAEAERFDSTLEFYFESPEALDRFCASDLMARIASLAKSEAEAVVWDAAQIQEVFFTSKGEQPLERSWLDFYAV